MIYEYTVPYNLKIGLDSLVFPDLKAFSFRVIIRTSLNATLLVRLQHLMVGVSTLQVSEMAPSLHREFKIRGNLSRKRASPAKHFSTMINPYHLQQCGSFCQGCLASTCKVGSKDLKMYLLVYDRRQPRSVPCPTLKASSSPPIPCPILEASSSLDPKMSDDFPIALRKGYVKTGEQLGDIFMKALNGAHIDYLCNKLGMINMYALT
uniref:Uncharacterized protein n=1 Tax=Cucumis melo TaxID=3656 RepID=A0A9I9E791_CUCME